MAVRRRLLGLLALASLAVLIYGGVSLAFSVPVDQRAVEENAQPETGVPAGHRAVVVPIVDPGLVPTLAGDGDPFLGHPGAFLAWGQPDGMFPANAKDVRLGRALLHLSAGTPPNETAESRFVNLTGVPMPHRDDPRGVDNLTLNLSALWDGRAGYIVKPDHLEEPLFVAQEEVVGQVVRFEAPVQYGLILAGGAFGFLAPLTVLVMTHGGQKRAPTGGLGMCAECRAPLAQGERFCVRCGAWSKENSP